MIDAHPETHAQKPEITMLLGAGFSQALTIPGTAAITTAVNDAMTAAFANSCEPLRNRLQTRFGDRYNFEVLAAALEACEPFGAPGYMPGAKYFAVEPEVATLKNDLDPEIARGMYELLISIVMDLVSPNWQTLVGPEIKLAAHTLFDTLCSDYKVNIATLNYDEALETFVQDGVDGFVGDGDYQEFRSNAFIANDDAPRIAHLHGSLRFGFKKESSKFVKTIGALKPRRTLGWVPRLDGSPYTSLITGAGKANKVVMPPYSVYFAWLANCLLSSPRVVVVGYGVGDVHINVWLANAMNHHPKSDLRFIIIDRFDPRDPPATLINLFALAAGLDDGAYTGSEIQALSYTDDVAYFNKAMIVCSGFPPSSSQLNAMKTFLED